MKRDKDDSLIRLQEVSKVYKTGNLPVFALKKVTLIIKKGEFTAILGPSGCGKSTLMHILGLLDTPTSGQVFFQGENSSRFSEEKLAKLRNQKIGFVFQSSNLLERTSALDNVMLPLVYAGTQKVLASQRCKTVLELVGLGDRLDHKPNQLSGGQQQRVAIARALVNDPEIILADEPTGNLDSISGSDVLAILKKLNKQGRTIVVVTHDKNIASCAEKIIKMKDGRVVN